LYFIHFFISPKSIDQISKFDLEFSPLLLHYKPKDRIGVPSLLPETQQKELFKSSFFDKKFNDLQIIVNDCDFIMSNNNIA